MCPKRWTNRFLRLWRMRLAPNTTSTTPTTWKKAFFEFNLIRPTLPSSSTRTSCSNSTTLRCSLICPNTHLLPPRIKIRTRRLVFRQKFRIVDELIFSQFCPPSLLCLSRTTSRSSCGLSLRQRTFPPAKSKINKTYSTNLKISWEPTIRYISSNNNSTR